MICLSRFTWAGSQNNSLVRKWQAAYCDFLIVFSHHSSLVEGVQFRTGRSSTNDDDHESEDSEVVSSPCLEILVLYIFHICRCALHRACCVCAALNLSAIYFSYIFFYAWSESWKHVWSNYWKLLCRVSHHIQTFPQPAQFRNPWFCFVCVFLIWI